MKKLFGIGTLVLLAGAVMLSSCDKEVPAETLSIEKELTIYVDSTYQLTAKVTPENATGTVNWTISDTAVATVSDAGLVKAIKKGSAIVTANLGNAVSACNVTVVNNPVTLELSMANIEQKKCTVAVKPSDEEGYYYCGIATTASIAKTTDEEIASSIVKGFVDLIEQYKAQGQTLTVKDFVQAGMLQQGEKNLIASSLTANTEYTVYALGIDAEAWRASNEVARLPFKTKEVVKSSMTFTMGVDSVGKVRKISGADTTYTYKGYFSCVPSTDKEKYVYNGVLAKTLDSLYNNDLSKYLSEMEAYYDKNYASYGGFEAMAKAGKQTLTASNLVHNTKYIFFAAGYAGGFTTDISKFEYTFVHPDSVKQPMPARFVPEFEEIREIDLRDFKGSFIPGVLH